ncbi:hypothetical protein JXB27_03165 [Candidatus Woesearchaeota archaeon]|nr:hypothetical protein [Candidatus Woesearchaeota archaeon]
MKCKKCKSRKVRPYKYENVDCYECYNCGYDSCEDNEFPEERGSQREKGRYNPYKAGRK